MSLARSLVVAFACFSRIPMPRVEWDRDSMRYAMAFFPWVGLAIGLVLWGWLALCRAASVGVLLRAAGVALAPVAVTGGIHLDGLADVVDAQSSHAELARKREILKDPHTGAFAIVGVACYLVAYLGLASELDATPAVAALLCGLHWESRCLSGVATLALPRSSGKGMLAAFGGSADKRRSLVALVAEWAAGVAATAWAWPAAAAAVAAGGVATLLWLRRFAARQFGGMSGDLAGFFLEVAELVMLACLVVATHLA